MTAERVTDRTSRVERIAAMVLIALGVTIRIWIRYPTDFWEDEIIAATHAVQPFWQIPVEALRNDTHPPLYFMQLHFWGWFGHSDVWLTLNSVVWSLVAIISVWSVGRKLYGARAALLAAAVFAVLPSPSYFADQLRMYSMLAAIIVWAFYLSVRLFEERRRTVAIIVGLELLLLAIIYTHAIGFVAVLLNGIYAFRLAMRRGRNGRALPLWFGIYGLAALAALPMLASGMLHDANLSDGGGFAGILASLAAPALGEIVYGSGLFLALDVLAYLAIIVFGLGSRRTVAQTLVFLVLPLVLSILVGLFFKPIFKWNFFSTMAAPFIGLIVAQALTGPSEKRVSWHVCAFLLVLLLLTMSIVTRLTHFVSSGFRDRANLIAANYRPGDLVYAPQQSVFWGAAWYLAGPNWGSPLSIAAAPSPQWQRVYRKLGPALVRALHLMPDTQLLDRGGIKILSGNESGGQAAGASRVWMLTMPRVDLKAGYPPATFNGLPQQWSDHNHTWLTLYAAGSQQVAVPPPLVRH
ncbi:MAG TPA: glycosyltransferase family 39 protein [Rhizomicrobium sp.]|nr:glycosyltransferase family 39 protein [Rhizomicrobium sp.]